MALTISVVLGLVGGVLLTNLERPQYTASASVLVTPTGVADSASLANSRTSGTINLDTEAQLAHSTQVAERVQVLDPARKAVSPPALLANLKISVPPNTEVLRLSYTAGSAPTAAKVANDFAAAYLDVRGDNANAVLQAQIKKISGNLKALNSSLSSVIKTLAGIQNDSKNKQINNVRKTQLINQITALTSQYSQLSVTNVTPGTQLSDATTPAQPSSPSLMLNGAAGLACGLLLGLVIAWFRFAKRRRMSRPDDVMRLVHLPVAATVGEIHPGTVEPTNSAAGGQYQRLVNLLVATVGSDGGVVLMTGAASNAPTDTVAANLAATLSRSAVPVSLLSLTGRMDRISTPGTPAVNVIDGQRAQAMAAGLTRAKLDEVRRGGFLVVTATDAGSSADAQTLAGLSDAVLVVVAARTKVRDGRAVVDQLDAVGAPILGAVLVPGEKSSRPTVLAAANVTGRTGRTGLAGKPSTVPAIDPRRRAAPAPDVAAVPKPPQVAAAHSSESKIAPATAVARSAAGNRGAAVGHPRPAAARSDNASASAKDSRNGEGGTSAANGVSHHPATDHHDGPHTNGHLPVHPHSDVETLGTEEVSVSALVRARSRAKIDRSSRR